MLDAGAPRPAALLDAGAPKPAALLAAGAPRPAALLAAALIAAITTCAASPPPRVSSATTAPAARAERARLPAAPVVRIASWNVKRLGHGRKRFDLVARLIDGQDVAVLQEVMSPAAVERLLAYLPGWSAVVSPRAVGRGGYAEHYAVLYRKRWIRPLRSFTVADRRDRFAREPFVVCLKARAFDFCVVAIHVVFGRTAGPRSDEVAALGPLMTRLLRQTSERDWLVVGDFNRPARAACWSPLAERGWSMATDKRLVPTSLSARGYRSDYDHILFNRRFTREWTGRVERVDMASDLCGGDFAWCIAHISDHAPIGATFSVAGSDDD